MKRIKVARNKCYNQVKIVFHYTPYISNFFFCNKIHLIIFNYLPRIGIIFKYINNYSILEFFGVYFNEKKHELVMIMIKVILSTNI